jgi:glycosyltransferase involved in cell wall biosynthesis
VVGWWPRVREAIDAADAVHVRCPCNIGLVAILALQRTRLPRYAMFGGEWRDGPDEPFFSRLQRRLLASPQFGGPVAIYGSWPDQPAHCFSCFSPNFTLAEWEAETPLIERRLAALGRTRPEPIRLVSVGHLNANKSQGTILGAVALLRQRGLDVRLDCIGDGPLRAQLFQQRLSLGLEDVVALPGALSYAEVCDAYRRAHFNVLASRREGYGKVVTEGMLHGCVPVAADVGIIAQMVDHGRRGRTFPLGDSNALADLLQNLSDRPEQIAEMLEEGRRYARTVTLEAFQRLHQEVLARHWALPLGMPSRVEIPRVAT